MFYNEIIVNDHRKKYIYGNSFESSSINSKILLFLMLFNIWNRLNHGMSYSNERAEHEAGMFPFALGVEGEVYSGEDLEKHRILLALVFPYYR